MSKLDELIAELCPDGVEYKKLEDISYKITDGLHNLPKDIRSEGEYPILSAINIGYGRIDTNTQKYVSKETFLKENPRTNVEINDVLLTIVGAIGRVAVVKTKLQALFQRSVCVIKPNQDIIKSEFLRYAIESSKIQKYIQMNAHGAAQKGFYLDQVCNLTLPVPPLEVQEEIVRVLDAFSELQAELQAELQSRKEQYEYYRDEMFYFENPISPTISKMIDCLCPNGVNYKRLGDIGEIIRGNGLQKKDFVEAGTGCIHYGQIYTYYGLFADTTKSFVSPELAEKLAVIHTGDIVIAVTSENVEDVCKCVAWLGKEDIVTGGHSAIFRHNQNPKYVTYWLSSKSFQEQKQKFAQGTKVIDVHPKKLENIVIPVPPLKVQEEIVRILDRFDALCNDITQGLPAEIEARRKQYEYYRDRLLTFKPKESAA